MKSMNNATISKEILDQFDELVKESGMQVNDLLKVLAKAYDISFKEEILSEINMENENYWDSFTA